MARYKLDVEAPETGLQSLGRNISRGISRAGEAFVGGLGDIAQGVTNIGSLGEQILEKNSPEFLKGSLPKPFEALGKVTSALPTTQGLKERSREQPHNEYERGLDNLITDFVSYANPLLGPLSVGGKTAAALSGVGNVAQWAAKGLGASENVQTGVKVGSVLAASLMGRPKTEAYKNSLYTAAREGLPEGAMVSSSLIEDPLVKVEKAIRTGHAGSAEREALRFLKSAKGKIDPITKKIPLESVWALKKNINEMAYTSSKTAPTKAVQRYLRPMQDALMQTIEKSETQYPAFVKNLRSADEIHRAQNSSGVIGQFLRDHIKLSSIKNPGTLLLLGGAQYAGFPAAAVGVGALAAKQAYLAGEALLRSPEIRKHYLNTVSSALKKNASATLKNARLLDESISKSGAAGGRYVLDDESVMTQV